MTSWTSRLAVTWRTAFVVASTVMVALALGACGDKTGSGRASQAAARVNDEEITVHQINFALQRRQGLKAEHLEAASREVLERLIDQELAVQRAQQMNLHRDPQVLQQIDAARREILARAYAERVGGAAAKPSPTDIEKYYRDNPILFKERRIYNVQEITIEAKPDQVEKLRSLLAGAKTVETFLEYLEANKFRFAGTVSVRGPEQLPLDMLDSFAKLKDGESLLVPSTSGAQVITLVSSRAAPVDEEAARSAIERFLVNDARRRLIESDVKAMRTGASVTYLGNYADAVGSARVGPTPEPAASEPVDPAELQRAAIKAGVQGLK